MEPYFRLEELGSFTKFHPRKGEAGIHLSNGHDTVVLPKETRKFLVCLGLELNLVYQNGVLLTWIVEGMLYTQSGEALDPKMAVVGICEPAVSNEQLGEAQKLWLSIRGEKQVVFTNGKIDIPLPTEGRFFAVTQDLIVEISGPDEDGTVGVEPLKGTFYGNMDRFSNSERSQHFCPAKTVIVDFSDEVPGFKEICDLPERS